MTREQREAKEREILDAIKFYTKRGWSWLDVVGYLAVKGTGVWP